MQLLQIRTAGRPQRPLRVLGLLIGVAFCTSWVRGEVGIQPGDLLVGPTPYFGLAPTGMTYDPAGNIYGFPTLYILDGIDGQAHLYRASDLAQVGTITGPENVENTGIAAGATELYWLAEGVLYQSEFNSGSLTEIAPVTLPLGGEPGDLTMGPDGNLWITDTTHAVYSKHSPVDASYLGELIYNPSGVSGLGSSLAFVPGCASFLIPHGTIGTGVNRVSIVDGTGQVLDEIPLAAYGSAFQGIAAAEVSEATGQPSFFIVDGVQLSVYELELGGCETGDCHESSASLSQPAFELSPVTFAVTPELPITDSQPLITSTLAVAGLTGPVRDLECRVLIDHSFIGDLRVTLRAPIDAAVLVLHDREGGGLNGLELLYSDRGRPSGAPFATGDRVLPAGPGCLADFDGLDPNGSWTLEVDDAFLGEEGQLIEWELRFGPELNIPDDDSVGLVLTFDIPAIPGASVGDLDAVIALDHTAPSELSATLTSPLGTSVELFSMGTADPNGRYDDDPGLGGFNDGFGTRVPAQALAGFDSEDPEGTWVLTITDTVAGNLGSVSGAELLICPSPCPAPSGLTCATDCATGALSLGWTNPEVYSSIDVLRNGVVVAMLDGSETSYTETQPAGEYRYEVRGTCGEGAAGTTCRVLHAPYSGEQNIVFWGEPASGSISSALALASELEAAGESVLLVDDFSGCIESLSPMTRIWLALGTFPANRPLTADEGQYLFERQAEGLHIYIEGGDGWGFDNPTPFAASDGIEVESALDGDDSLEQLLGVSSVELDLSDLTAAYLQDQPFTNEYTDRIWPTGTDFSLTLDDYGTQSYTIWSSGDYPVGNFYLPLDEQIGSVVAQSWEFGGYGGDRQELLGRYLSVLTRTGVPFRRGDINSDGAQNIADAIFLLGFLFISGEAPACTKAADTNDSGSIDISDAINLLNYLFVANSPPPPPPFPGCGEDPIPDTLDCGGTCL